MLQAVLLVLGAILAVPSIADAKKFVGFTNGYAPTTVGRVRFSPCHAGSTTSCTAVLRARFKCKAEIAPLCPSMKRGKILGEVQHPGDFYGALAFKDGVTCRVVGSLTSLDGVLWEQGLPPQQAPGMGMFLDCGADLYDEEETHGFIGEKP